METDFSKLLLDETPDAIVATTTEGRVLHWSKACRVKSKPASASLARV